MCITEIKLRARLQNVLQVRSLQADLKQSDNQLHEVQTRLEILQAQILSAAPNVCFSFSRVLASALHIFCQIC